MKNFTLLKIACLAIIMNLTLFISRGYGQTGTGINSTGAQPDPSAMLDVSSTTQGTLFTRMTTDQRDAIGSPATGLIIYNTDCNTFEYFNGTSWISIYSSVNLVTAPSGLSGSTSVCSGQTGVNYSVSPVSGVTSYNWSVPDGSSITDGQGTTSITVTFGSNSGNICVTGSSTCGTSLPSCLPITLVGTPTAITVSGGTEPTCQLKNGTTTTTYATTATNNTGFNWSLATGWSGTITPGVITPTTGVMTWTNNFSGTVTIQAQTNACNGPNSIVTRTVTVTPTVGKPSTPITTTPLCIGAGPTPFTTYSTDATSYNWSVTGAGNSISGTGTTATVTWNSTYTGAAIVSVTANGCNGPSAGTSATATIVAYPNVSNFSVAAVGCAGYGSTVVINSSSLVVGTYVVTYNFTGTNTATGTAPMSFTAGTPGNGTFITSVLDNTGATTLTITSIQNSNGCSSVVSSGNTVDITVGDTWTCGCALVVNHVAGAVSPVTTTITYGTVSTTLTGSNLCWITQNLGATNQAVAGNDGTAAAAGWYWKYGWPQGWCYIGGTFYPAISGWTYQDCGNGDWVTANDPCNLLLGSGWRIPTKTEFTTAITNGGWSAQYNSYKSILKIHHAGHFTAAYPPVLNEVGTTLYSWSSTNSGTKMGYYLFESTGGASTGSANGWTGHSIRCVR